MKTRINRPREEAFARMPIKKKQDDDEMWVPDLGTPFSDFLDSLLKSGCPPVAETAKFFGCHTRYRGELVGSFCDLLNGYLATAGCQRVTQCERDSDCNIAEECNEDGRCVPDPDDCRTGGGKDCKEWEECNEDTGRCDPVAGHCHFTGCSLGGKIWGHCHEDTGICEPYAGRCAVDGHCDDPAKPYCDTNKTSCELCTPDHLEKCDEGEICDTSGPSNVCASP